MLYILPKGDCLVMFVKLQVYLYCFKLHCLFSLIVLIFNFIVTFSVNNNVVTIEIIDGFNFKKWKEDVEFAMEMANVHTTLYADKPTDLIEESTNADRAAYAI